VKPLYIKIWPEIENDIPVLLPWQGIEKKKNTVFIDFTNCKEVRSSSLLLILIKLLKMIKNDIYLRNWETHNEIINEEFKKIVKLDFFKIFDKYKRLNSIFDNNEFVNTKGDAVVKVDSMGNNIISFPIHCIEINKNNNRREILKDFRTWISNLLEPYYNKYDFNLTQLVLVLGEIVKNSADHTNDNAFMGIDISTNISNELIEISFAIGDLGVGINMNIKNNLPHNKLERLDYWDLTQTYKWALEEGSSSSNSEHNKGLGMSLILNGSRGMKLYLSVYDAQSRGILSNIKELTHGEIRKNFYNLGNPVGFFYFGKLKAVRI
jgi:hypothetical protein